MARAHRIAFLMSVLTTMYLFAFFDVVSVPFVNDDIAQKVLPVIPWWCLVSFGSFSLWSIGWGLFTFRDCPDAYTELLSNISQAKTELRAKGISVD